MGEGVFFYWLTEGLLIRQQKQAPNRLAHSSNACELGGSSHAFDSMPDVCDEGGTDVTGLSYNPTSFESPESFESFQGPDIQPGFNLESLESGHGAENLYGDATDTREDWPLVHATALKTNGSDMTAMEECRDTFTVASAQGPPQSFAPNLLNESSPQQDCTCISCLGIGTEYYSIPFVKGQGRKCRFPGCLTFPDIFDIPKFFVHERCHYGQSGKYTCLELDCQVVTKHFGDLRRHYKAKHCTNPNKEQFPCPVVWCKYSGDNGFARKDKLKSHYKNIHEGKAGLAKAGRVLKPAALRPKVSGFEGSSSK